MKYYKAPLKIVNGQKVYGNLAPKTIIAHDHDGFGYFTSSVPWAEDTGLTEISELEYTNVIELLCANVRAQHEEAEQRAESIAQEREKRMSGMEMAIADLLYR